MTAVVGTSTNTNSEANVLAGITLGATSTTLLAAQTVGDPPRIKVIVQNSGATKAWIKFQPASDDNDVKGIAIPMNSSAVVLEGSDIYTGEISGIAAMGSPEVFVTWF